MMWLNPVIPMTNSYHDLVKQTFNFPQEGFEVEEVIFISMDLT